MVSINICYFYARVSFISLLPKFIFLGRFSKNGLDCLEVKGVSRVTIAQGRRDSQAQRPSPP